MPPPFQQEEHFRLYRYFAHCVLPRRLVRQTSLSRYSDQKHMLRLAIAYPPLMGATIAIAAMKEIRQSHQGVRLAVESYLFTLNNLREGIKRGKYTGNEDWLLATTVLLCVFENARCDSMPNARPHVLASAKLLSLRAPRFPNCSQDAVVFERVCAESFLYHVVFMTLFDSSLGCPSSILGKLDLSRYFSDPIHPEDSTLGSPASTQPILDASYKFYLLIVDVIWLARASFSPNSIDYKTWTQLRNTFVRWEDAISNGNSEDMDNDIRKLYAIGIWMLLVQANPLLSADDISNSLESWFQHGLAIISRLDLPDVFAYYYLWPLVIVGSIAVNPADRRIIEDKVYEVSRPRQEACVSLANHRLKNAWARGTRCNNRSLQVLRQFEAILDGK
ncbi:hypothetical protein PHISCL_00677 [Aspergillus sclerotialis]|uniref:Uncharacterized protein n=1 Tax=Aspergillus sclerotialis TaxID=2070753 RepID=A0A3A2ZV92_9EURO|nr:hypothetical protein PHISCL_00677 [Aspergillus sclerotialis]